jgi:hypothetical protein
MPYSITTKDGITIQNIPDDVASDSQVLKDRVAKIRAEGGASSSGEPSSGAPRQLGLGARHVIEGVAAGAGMVTDPVIEAIGGAVRMATGSDYDPATLASIGRNVANALGLPQPATSTEKVVGAAARGLAGGLSGAGVAQLATGVTTGVARTAAQTLAAQPGLQAVAGAASGAAGQSVQEGGGGSGAQLAAALAAGISAPLAVGAAGKAAAAARTPPAPRSSPPAALSSEELSAVARNAANGGIGSKEATRELAEQSLLDQKTIEAAQRLGIADYLQPDHVTTSQSFRELSQAIKSVPGSVTRMAELEGLEAVARRADEIVVQYGGSNDPSTLNNRIKKTMLDTTDELTGKADNLYSQMRAAIPARDPAAAPTVLAFIEKRAADLGGTKNLSPMEKMIVAKLTPKTRTVQENVPGNPLIPGQRSASRRTVQQVDQPTYALLDDVRRDLTAARVKRQGPFKDADTGLIKKLEASLAADQRAAIEPYGMLDTFNAAQKAVAVRKGLEDDMVSLFGKQISESMVGDLSSAMAALPKGDTSKFINLMKAIPENLRQEATATGLTTAFNISARNQKLSFGNFANWYEGLLKNKQAHAALMSNLPPEARIQMRDFYRVARGISLATKERITTGRIMAVEKDLRGADNLMSSIYGVAKRAAAGAAAEVVTTPLGLPGAGVSAGLASALTKGKPDTIKAADKLISSPEFLAAARNPTAAPSLASSRAFKAFVRAIGNPSEIGDPAQWIARALATANSENDRERELEEEPQP